MPDDVAPARRRGPGEDALERRLRAALPDAPPFAVERADKPAPAPFHLTVATPDGGPRPTRADLAPLAAAVSALDWVDRVATIPPRIYLSPDLAFLRDAVAREVVARGRHYGWSSAGAATPYVVSIGCPNANKPLHVGHLRNCFLGVAVSRLLETNGHPVLRTEELANYGIHICQALVPYLQDGGGATPTDTGHKPDHFVGSFYTRFHQGDADHEAAAGLLARMEAGDAELLAVNERVTEWAIAGIRETYARIGMRHDFVLRELEALPVARALVERGLADGTVLRRPDGSAYVDLSDAGLGEVTLLRQDGSPLALVQFVAIWVRRAQLHPHHRVVRITGSQWQQAFAQFLEVLRRLGHPEIADATEDYYHGMVRTGQGKIRSRFGNDVGADLLVDLLRDRLVDAWTAGLGGRIEPVQREACETYAVALLKYHVLGRRREDDVTFTVEELWSNVLPRLDRILRLRARLDDVVAARAVEADDDSVVPLLVRLDAFPTVLHDALVRRNTSNVVQYVDDVVRLARSCDARGTLDATAAQAVAIVLSSALWVLGIELPSLGQQVPTAVAAEAMGWGASVPV